MVYKIDAWSMVIGIISFLSAWSYGIYLLKKFQLNQKWIIYPACISLIGHFIGALAIFYYSVTIGSDSVYYFQSATTKYSGLGYWAAFLILGYAKKYILGDSFLGAFLISGAIGFVASIYYLLTFKILLSRTNEAKPLTQQQIIYPAFLLLCWPSYFFLSAGLIKDNFSFLSISMILFVIANGVLNTSTILTFLAAFCLSFFVRPYLFVIFSFSFVIYFILSKQTMAMRIIFFLSLILLTFLLLPLLHNYYVMMHFPHLALRNIGNYAIQQQEYMHIGACFPIPTHNPFLTFLFIPYFMLANTLLPLGIGISGKLSIMSTIENAGLVVLIIFFIKNWSIWKEANERLNILRFFIIYFIVGMACLSIVNTNIGLAMREKMLYVPALLICIFLTYSYKKAKNS